MKSAWNTEMRSTRLAIIVNFGRVVSLAHINQLPTQFSGLPGGLVELLDDGDASCHL